VGRRALRSCQEEESPDGRGNPASYWWTTWTLWTRWTIEGNDSLIPKHGGYRNLKSFQRSRLVYDLTVRFCDHYINPKSRTHDQMVQAARSGVQNIAEGSQASGTSKKTEITLTSVARSSLEELKLDYEDYLRHHNLPLWDRNDLRRENLITRRPQTEDDVAEWARDVHRGELGGHGGRSGHSGLDTTTGASTQSTTSTESTPSTENPTYPEILANATHALIAVSTALLDRQIASQGESFEKEGGFTERLYRRRQNRRRTE
jgi:four helix bundle suffix protein